MIDIKYIGTFIGGSIVGAAISFIFTKKYCDRIKEEEISSIKEHFTVKKEPYLKKNYEPDTSLYSDDEPCDMEYVDECLDDIPKHSNTSNDKVNYGAMFKKGSARFDILTSDEFDTLYEAIPRYLNYYLSDSILANADTDETIMNAADTIGEAAIKELNERNDILHVHDKELNIRYEIYIIKAAYKQE